MQYLIYRTFLNIKILPEVKRLITPFCFDTMSETTKSCLVDCKFNCKSKLASTQGFLDFGLLPFY